MARPTAPGKPSAIRINTQLNTPPSAPQIMAQIGTTSHALPKGNDAEILPK